jgi:hypothetical protein
MVCYQNLQVIHHPWILAVWKNTSVSSRGGGLFLCFPSRCYFTSTTPSTTALHRRDAPLPMASGPRRTSSTGGRACATATMGPFLLGCCLGIASSSGVIARRRPVMTQARCRTLHPPRSVRRRTVPPDGALGPTGAGGGAGSGAGGAGQGRGRHVAAVTNPGCGAPLPRGQAGPWTQILHRTAARRKTPNLCPPL